MASEVIAYIAFHSDNKLSIKISNQTETIDLRNYSIDFNKSFDREKNLLVKKELEASLREIFKKHTKGFWIFSKPIHCIITIPAKRNEEDISQINDLLQFAGGNKVEFRYR